MSLGHFVNLVICEAIIVSHPDYWTFVKRSSCHIMIKGVLDSCEYLTNVYEHNRARAFLDKESERKYSTSSAKMLRCDFVPFVRE